MDCFSISKIEYTYNFRVRDLSDNVGIGSAIPITIEERPPETCTDGTVHGNCSSNLPLYCNDGILSENCSLCGCDYGYACSGDGSCTIKTCSDGTTHGECSLNKPYYCDNGILSENCSLCGCGAGYECNYNGSCSFLMCNDGTPYGQCSDSKPLLCNNGILIDNCTVCGCSNDTYCNITTDGCFAPEPEYNCSDGTPYGACSPEQPLFCQNGFLINNCTLCGCEEGYECSWFGTCTLIPNNCSDGTLYGNCSASKPLYCENGILIDNCQVCGCEFEECNNDTGQCIAPLPPPPEPTVDITLYSGWNMFAIPEDPIDDSLTTVLAEIEGKYDRVYAYDSNTQDWIVYRINKTIFDSTNDLSNLKQGRGYWINIIEPVSLTLDASDDNYTKELVRGWNFVGYPYSYEMIIEQAVSSIDGKYDIVYYYDTLSDSWELYTPHTSAIIDNTLIKMEPGKGYWIYMYEQATWSP